MMMRQKVTFLNNVSSHLKQSQGFKMLSFRESFE